MLDAYFDQPFYNDVEELGKLMSAWRASRIRFIDARAEFGGLTNAILFDDRGFTYGAMLASQGGMVEIEGQPEFIDSAVEVGRKLKAQVALTYTWADEWTNEDWDKLLEVIESKRGVEVHVPGGHSWTIRNMSIPERLAGKLVVLTSKHAGWRAYRLALAIYHAIERFYDSRGEIADVEVKA